MIRAQIRPADFEQRAVFAGPASDQTAPARELVHFAGKHPAAEHTEDGPISGRTANDLDAAVEDEKDAVMLVALIEKDFTGPRAPLVPERRQAPDLRIIQRWEHRGVLFGSFRHDFFHNGQAAAAASKFSTLESRSRAIFRASGLP